jgi:hypothetical protein
MRFFFGGALLSDSSYLYSAGCKDGSVVSVVHKYPLEDSLVKECLNKSSGWEDGCDDGFDDFNTKHKSAIELILIALSKRRNPNPLIRRYARNLIMDLMASDSRIVEKAMRITIKDDLVKVHSLERNPFEYSGSSGATWIPIDESLMYKDVCSAAAAKDWQKTPAYSLMGDVVLSSEDLLQAGLIKPVNYSECVGSMTSVSSVVWRAVANSHSIFLKGILPLNPINDALGRRKGDTEFKIQLSMPPHPNIIPILHQFVGSSSLVYPFLSKEIRDMNDRLYDESGRRLVRRYTTYFVFDCYPETLRAYKNKFFVINERQLCLMALQVLDCVSHLNLHQVSHCNINQDNTFVSHEGKLLIGNFSSALACSSYMKYQSVEHAIDQLRESKGSSVLAPEVEHFLKTHRYSEITEEHELWEVMKSIQTNMPPFPHSIYLHIYLSICIYIYRTVL